MKEFSDDEKTIARNINEEYEWMARDRDGCLYIFDEKPKKLLNVWNVIFDGLPYRFKKMVAFSHMFSSVKWENDEPTLIRDIYDPKILDGVERKYLEAVLKPFRDEVDYVVKFDEYRIEENAHRKEYLHIQLYDQGFFLPYFDSGKMYSGMELNKRYKLDELGITYMEDNK